MDIFSKELEEIIWKERAEIFVSLWCEEYRLTPMVQ